MPWLRDFWAALTGRPNIRPAGFIPEEIAGHYTLADGTSRSGGRRGGCMCLAERRRPSGEAEADPPR
jgi:hypothetical protein